MVQETNEYPFTWPLRNWERSTPTDPYCCQGAIESISMTMEWLCANLNPKTIWQRWGSDNYSDDDSVDDRYERLAGNDNSQSKISTEKEIVLPKRLADADIFFLYSASQLHEPRYVWPICIAHTRARDAEDYETEQELILSVIDKVNQFLDIQSRAYCDRSYIDPIECNWEIDFSQTTDHFLAPRNVQTLGTCWGVDEDIFIDDKFLQFLALELHYENYPYETQINDKEEHQRNKKNLPSRYQDLAGFLTGVALDVNDSILPGVANTLDPFRMIYSPANKHTRSEFESHRLQFDWCINAVTKIYETTKDQTFINFVHFLLYSTIFITDHDAAVEYTMIGGRILAAVLLQQQRGASPVYTEYVWTQDSYMYEIPGTVDRSLAIDVRFKIYRMLYFVLKYNLLRTTAKQCSRDLLAGLVYEIKVIGTERKFNGFSESVSFEVHRYLFQHKETSAQPRRDVELVSRSRHRSPSALDPLGHKDKLYAGNSDPDTIHDNETEMYVLDSFTLNHAEETLNKLRKQSNATTSSMKVDVRSLLCDGLDALEHKKTHSNGNSYSDTTGKIERNAPEHAEKTLGKLRTKSNLTNSSLKVAVNNDGDERYSMTSNQFEIKHENYLLPAAQAAKNESCATGLSNSPKSHYFPNNEMYSGARRLSSAWKSRETRDKRKQLLTFPSLIFSPRSRTYKPRPKTDDHREEMHPLGNQQQFGTSNLTNREASDNVAKVLNVKQQLPVLVSNKLNALDAISTSPKLHNSNESSLEEETKLDPAMEPAKLTLADGTILSGLSFAANRTVTGEIKHVTGDNKSLPEIMSDPASSGQILVVSVPIVGNFAIPDNASGEMKFHDKIHIRGLIVSKYSGNHDDEIATVRSIGTWLKQHDIPGVFGVDTQLLLKTLQSRDSLIGKIEMCKKQIAIRDPHQTNLVGKFAANTVRIFGEGNSPRILLLDCGVRPSTIRSLLRHGVEVIAASYNFNVKEASYDGIFVTDGQYSPDLAKAIISKLKRAITKQNPKPIFGECLGHRLLALAAGAKVYESSNRNLGVKRQVLDLRTTKCYTTSQCHSYAVDDEALPHGWHTYFMDSNDYSNAGLMHETKPFSSVQFHPEVGKDTAFLYRQFIATVKLYVTNSRR